MTNFNFEQSMLRLNEIATLLEREDLPIDDAIKLFEEGLALSKVCQQKLNDYEVRVKELVDKHNDSE